MPDKSFYEAKEILPPFLHRMSALAVEMHKKYPDKNSFVFHASNLIYLRDKVKAAVKPNLSSDDLDKLVKFRLDIIFATKFQRKLADYDALISALIGAVLEDKIRDIKINWFSENQARISSVNRLTQEIEIEVKNNPTKISTILSVMHVISSRKGLFDFLIIEYLKSVKSLPELEKYDIYEICSVENKVKRGDGYDTDVNAMRVCIAHNYYTIEDTKTGKIIHFENTEKGWSFRRDYTGKEFMLFFDDYLTRCDLHHNILSLHIHEIVIIMNLLKP